MKIRPTRADPRDPRSMLINDHNSWGLPGFSLVNHLNDNIPIRTLQTVDLEDRELQTDL